VFIAQEVAARLGGLASARYVTGVQVPPVPGGFELRARREHEGQQGDSKRAVGFSDFSE